MIAARKARPQGRVRRRRLRRRHRLEARDRARILPISPSSTTIRSATSSRGSPGRKVFVAHDVQTGALRRVQHGCGTQGAPRDRRLGGHRRRRRTDHRPALHLGASGLAGDIGHYLLHSMDVSSEAPRKEILDNVASRTAIAGEAAALAAKHRAPALRRSSRAPTSTTSARATLPSDPQRRQVGRDAGAQPRQRDRRRALQPGRLPQPRLIVLGGGLVEEMPALMRREVRKSIDAHAATKAAKAVKVVVAKLHPMPAPPGRRGSRSTCLPDEPPLTLYLPRRKKAARSVNRAAPAVVGCARSPRATRTTTTTGRSPCNSRPHCRSSAPWPMASTPSPASLSGPEPYAEPRTLRALYSAVDLMQKEVDREQPRERLPANFGKPWTAEEDRLLSPSSIPDSRWPISRASTSVRRARSACGWRSWGRSSRPGAVSVAPASPS